MIRQVLFQTKAKTQQKVFIEKGYFLQKE